MRRLLSATAIVLALASPAYAYREAERGDVRLFGAKCDAQVLYDNVLVTAGSGGTRQVTLGGTPTAFPSAGQIISTSVGGASAPAAWQGTVVSVAGAGSANPVVTVTAAAGTAVASPTSAVVQWGTDNYVSITTAIARLQGISPIIIPGQCGVSNTLYLTAKGADFHGTIPPAGHHDHSIPYYPELSSALVWLGGSAPMLIQKSVDGASNFEVRGQNVHDLSFYAGNSASVGRAIATVANSVADSLYAADATQYNFEWGLNGATTLAEVASTCYLKESNFVSDGVLTGGVGYIFSGDIGNNWNTCASQFDNFTALFGTADGMQLVVADHNIFTNPNLIGNGASTTAYSIHFSGVNSTYYAQANGFKKVTASNFGVNPALGRVRFENLAQGNWIEQLDNYNPPSGWVPSVAAGVTFSCTWDNGSQCLAQTVATLPTCSNSSQANTQGKEILVTDATSSTFGAAIVGGGGNSVKAWCDPVSQTWKVR